MKTKLKRPLAAMGVAVAVMAQAVAGQLPPSGVLAVTGVTVIDGTGAPPQPNTTVVIRDGRISHVGPAATTAVPPEATVIEASGKWLVPGFVDTHAHVSLGPVLLDYSSELPALKLTSDPEIPLRTLRTLLAHGITSVRDPGGDPGQLVPLREAVAAGALIGPRMKVAGKVIDTTPFEGLVNQVSDVESIRKAVRTDAEAGVDMAKLYVMLDPEMLKAAIDEAHAQGIETIAHLMTTSWTQAAELGIDNIVHIVPGSADLLPVDARAGYRESRMRGTQFMYEWFARVDLDGAEIAEMIEALVRNDVSIDPTLVMFEGMIRGDDPYYTDSEALGLAAPSMVENWRTLFHFNIGWSEADYLDARATWPTFLELARRLHEADVVLTAGTDANNPWIVPGHSFHRELELLVQAGIPPLEVLSIATRNGARVSGFAGAGTIEEGHWADLVLLEANPVADISNTRAIEWVMQAGRVFDPDDLMRGIR